MTTRQVAVVALALLCAVGLALPAVGAQETATPADENESDGSAGLGDELTAFMQSSAAEANDTVEAGMWQASFEHANESDRARLATNRTRTLEQRLEQLRERNRTLTARYENGSLPQGAYVAQASRLSGRIAALRASINDTERAAASVGVDEARLADLRSEARNVSGPGVPGVARGLTEGQGPPAGTPGSPGAAGANETPGASGNGSQGNGPPPNAGPGGNETDDANGSDDGPDQSGANAGGGNGDARDGGNGNAAGDGSDGDTGSDGAGTGNGNGSPGSDSDGSDGDTSDDDQSGNAGGDGDDRGNGGDAG